MKPSSSLLAAKRPTRLLHALVGLAQPYGNPVGFIEAHLQGTWSGRNFWRWWGFALLLGIVTQLLLGIPWGEWRVPLWGLLAFLIGTLLAGLMTLFSVGMGMPEIGDHKFWIYHFISLPFLVAAFVCGLQLIPWPPLKVIGGLVGWLTLWPFLLGSILTTLGAVWCHKATEKFRKELRRQHHGALPAALPALGRWRRVRLVRWLAALGWTLLLLSTVRQPSHLVGVSWIILAGVVGCFHWEASLMALLNYPLVAAPPYSPGWRASYVGRKAMWVPRSKISDLLATLSSWDGATALLALCREGCLEPVVAATVARLPAAQAEALLEALSLQAGGGALLQSLAPALPTTHSALATCYARLADEAARPLDVQRWLLALTDCNGSALGSTPASHRLALIENALASSRQVAPVKQALDEMEGWLARLPIPIASETATGEARPWLQALFLHVQSHHTALLALHPPRPT